MKNKGFPRFFINTKWESLLFVKINNKKDFGFYFFKNGSSEKSAIMDLKRCLDYEYKEIQEHEAILML